MADFDADPAGLRSAIAAEKNRFISLNATHIGNALQDSSDNGATLIFSRLNLSDIGGESVEYLTTVERKSPDDQGSVKRIALDHNHLAALPTEFALLSCLRYLNLKHNSFSVFPDVLTSISSLDTLDISYNKIRKLPTEPGHLINLRVFSMSRNKITRLPPYLVLFTNLDVLQVERNPIEWPPRYVTEPTGGLDSIHAMQDWIRTLQRWMEMESREKQDDPGYSGEHLSPIRSTEDSYSSWKSRLQDHTRSYSADSNFSMSSIEDSLPSGYQSGSLFPHVRLPPFPLHFGIIGTPNTEPSPTYSPHAEPFRFHNTVQNERGERRRHIKTRSFDALRDGDVLRREAADQRLPADLKVITGATMQKINHADLPLSSFDGQARTQALSLSSRWQQSTSVQTDGNDDLKIPLAKDRDPPLPTPALSLISERDAYFERFSALPVCRTLPKALVQLVSSIRNILFAVGEIYRSLERYTIHVADDRISATLCKILEAANADIFQLVHSLDRFDVTSQKMFPAPVICRNVVESCRDTVSMLGKTLAILGRQLKGFTGEDTKYARWILLELHAGAMEISLAWQSVLPQAELLKSLLRTKGFPTSALVLPSVASELGPLDTAHRSVVSGGLPSGTIGRARATRRNAGSFSSKDVEIGKNLPSYEDFPGNLGGIAPGSTTAPTLRAPKRQMTAPVMMIHSSSPPFAPPQLPMSKSDQPNGYLSNPHSRQGSQASLGTAEFFSSSIPSRPVGLGLPPDSHALVEKEAIQAVHTALEIAPVVCDMLEEVLADIMDIKNSVRDTIKQARIATMRLSDTVRSLEDANTVRGLKALREDAYTFLKNVVQLSNIVKTYAGLHSSSSTLRTNIIKLTSSTEEFAILLHVSSFAPSTTPRPYTPAMNLSIALDEKQLGSTQHLHNSPTFPAYEEAGHVASHTQTVHVRLPNTGLPQGMNSYVDITDPG